MRKSELIKKCKELGIQCNCKKSKKEIQNLIDTYNKNTSKTKKDEIKQNIDDQKFFNTIAKHSTLIKDMEVKISFLLHEFGTYVPCNRFDVGNCIEFITSDAIQSTGLEVEELPNEKRIDINIKNYKRLSIKYSSSGVITLHNSNSCINKDIKMRDTFLITPKKIYLIIIKELNNYKINIEDYLDNKGDSLKLKRKILKELEKKKYPYILSINIKYDNKTCKNRLCSKIFYKQFNIEFESLNK